MKKERVRKRERGERRRRKKEEKRETEKKSKRSWSSGFVGEDIAEEKESSGGNEKRSVGRQVPTFRFVEHQV